MMMYEVTKMKLYHYKYICSFYFNRPPKPELFEFWILNSEFYQMRLRHFWSSAPTQRYQPRGIR